MTKSEKIKHIDNILNKIKNNFIEMEDEHASFFELILTHVEFISDEERREDTIESFADFIMYYQARYMVDKSLLEDLDENEE